jgi:hypothetical protein
VHITINKVASGKMLNLYRGFAEEGRRRNAVFQDGQWTDLLSMGILFEEWDAQRKGVQVKTEQRSEGQGLPGTKLLQRRNSWVLVSTTSSEETVDNDPF